MRAAVFDGDSVTLPLAAADLELGTEYEVRISEEALMDVQGNLFDGIPPDVHRFTTLYLTDAPTLERSPLDSAIASGGRRALALAVTSPVAQIARRR